MEDAEHKHPVNPLLRSRLANQGRTERDVARREARKIAETGPQVGPVGRGGIGGRGGGPGRSGGAGGPPGAAAAASAQNAERTADGPPEGGRGDASRMRGSGYNCIFVGAKGYLGTSTGDNHAAHCRDWVRACKGGAPACSNFSIAGKYTEWLLLGAVAVHHEGKLSWDPVKGAAAALLLVATLSGWSQQPAPGSPGVPGGRGGRGGPFGPLLPPEQQALVNRINKELAAETLAVTAASSNLFAASFATPKHTAKIAEANNALAKAREAWAIKTSKLIEQIQASDTKLSAEAIAQLVANASGRGGRVGPGRGFGGPGAGRPGSGSAGRPLER